jgi:hypothetical protein
MNPPYRFYIKFYLKEFIDGEWEPRADFIEGNPMRCEDDVRRAENELSVKYNGRVERLEWHPDFPVRPVFCDNDLLEWEGEE